MDSLEIPEGCRRFMRCLHLGRRKLWGSQNGEGIIVLSLTSLWVVKWSVNGGVHRGL